MRSGAGAGRACGRASGSPQLGRAGSCTEQPAPRRALRQPAGPAAGTSSERGALTVRRLLRGVVPRQRLPGDGGSCGERRR